MALLEIFFVGKVLTLVRNFLLCFNPLLVPNFIFVEAFVVMYVCLMMFVGYWLEYIMESLRLK